MRRYLIFIRESGLGTEPGIRRLDIWFTAYDSVHVPKALSASCLLWPSGTAYLPIARQQRMERSIQPTISTLIIGLFH